MRTWIVITACGVCLSADAVRATAADGPDSSVYQSLFTGAPAAKASPWRVSLEQQDAAPLADALASVTFDGDQQPRPRVVAFEYSEAYKTRARIHKIASIATLPLFATEVYLGQSVYNGTSPGRRSAHVAVGAGIGALFVVNSVTGVWNLWEGRKDPTNRKLRFAHGLLMLAADAGFFATAASGPNTERELEHRRIVDPTTLADQRSRHRTIALTSIGIGTVGYLVMLLGGH